MAPPARSWVTRSISRRQLLSGAVAGAASLALAGPVPLNASRSARPSLAADFDAGVSTAWFDLMLQLIKRTPGFSPPVASRAIGCAGLGLYEAVVPGMPGYRSLAGVLTDLPALPADGMNPAYHWPTVANSVLAAMMRSQFPTAPADLQAAITDLEATFEGDAPLGIRTRSIDRGQSIAAAIDAWARDDGGHEGYLRNFPTGYVPPTGPGLWAPTPPGNLRALQPFWGSNRCMALSSADQEHPGAHPDFSTDDTSAFFAEAAEVFEAVEGLTAEQLAITLFWADGAGTSSPAGHSISILSQVLASEGSSLATAAEAYARLGIAVCDAFIACWHVKFQYNLLRPITYIREHIDPGWGDPLPVTTPPFPEYTSGHSVQSGATTEVLTALFGSVSFTDHTHDAIGLPARSFASFDDAANEAAISRLYGGIHYRSAIERGLEQGRGIGAKVAALPMQR